MSRFFFFSKLLWLYQKYSCLCLWRGFNNRNKILIQNVVLPDITLNCLFFKLKVLPQKIGAKNAKMCLEFIILLLPIAKNYYVFCFFRFFVCVLISNDYFNICINRNFEFQASSNWVDWLRFKTNAVGHVALNVCDYLGDNLSSFFGITTPKYQFEIDHYNMMKKLVS